jgi:multicomponent Na+:H+ antiporter subunit E
MTLFVWNLLLAGLWAAIHGSFSLPRLVTGFVAGYAVLLLARPLIGPSRYYTGLWRAVAFALAFVRDLVAASLRVAAQILTPAGRLRPGIVAVPLRLDSDGEITFLANLISLTPGTLVIDVAEDRRTLYVHAIDIPGGDPAVVRRAIEHGLERRVVALLR